VEGVYCAVRFGSLNIIQVNLSHIKFIDHLNVDGVSFPSIWKPRFMSTENRYGAVKPVYEL